MVCQTKSQRTDKSLATAHHRTPYPKIISSKLIAIIITVVESETLIKSTKLMNN